mmetsp:Transcript_34371/g.65687  ORF Transcript_34371/g.65687 Transcript_34371/m.65687 type:complete len:260 (+) Transcript_34371:1140-1919(+)
MRSTCTMTNPPQFFAAMAWLRTSKYKASCSMDTLPCASAVVPRRSATWMGNALYQQYSSPFMCTSSTRFSTVAELTLPPFSLGSTNVPSPIFVIGPGLFAAMSRNRCDIAPKGRFHAVTLLLLTSFSKPGAVPIHAYVKDDTSPSLASASVPRPSLSPTEMPNTKLKLRGRLVASCLLRMALRSVSAPPQPTKPPTVIVVPSGTSAAAWSAVITFDVGSGIEESQSARPSTIRSLFSAYVEAVDACTCWCFSFPLAIWP